LAEYGSLKNASDASYVYIIFRYVCLLLFKRR